MKKVWFAIVFISIIFSVNFVYTRRINSFSDNITGIVNQAVSLADTDYEACGKYIDTLLEELDKSSLLFTLFQTDPK